MHMLNRLLLASLLSASLATAQTATPPKDTAKSSRSKPAPSAQPSEHAAHAAAAPPGAPPLVAGFGHVNHRVKTSSPLAQRYFNQGLALAYGFNHDEAKRDFEYALKLDPKMAMGWWGVAYVVGPNYNLPIDNEREKEAFSAIQKAMGLSEGGPQVERDYIEALGQRYSNDTTPDFQQLAQDSCGAMRELSRKYPDDLDAATLFAESAMNLHPWQLWNHAGTPAAGTEEIVATLESVLKRDPNHLGANHFYIHAVEASNHPERALPSAERLAALAPASGHLVHMPGHIYIRTGDHEASEKTNENAAVADEAFIRANKPQGIYPMMYYTHNLHFLAIENSMLGRYEPAIAAAQKIHAHVGPFVKQMDMLQAFDVMPMLVMVRFRRWDDILKLPQPPPSQIVSTGMWRYARGLAFASQNKTDDAKRELAALNQVAPEMAKIPTNSVGPGNAERIPQIAAHIIEARIAAAQGDNDGAVEHLRWAVALQDEMDYNEPPDWFYPVRESLGGALLQAGRPQEAEKVFREDLDANPRNPRSLFGLMEALTAEGRKEDAGYVQTQFENAWKLATVKLTVAEL